MSYKDKEEGLKNTPLYNMQKNTDNVDVVLKNSIQLSTTPNMIISISISGLRENRSS
jgi:hypothetical protein